MVMKSLEFKPGDSVIKPFFLPPDEMPHVRTKFEKLERRFDIELQVNPNCWVVNPDDERNIAVDGLWKTMLHVITDNPGSYEGTSVMPLRDSGKAITSLVHFGAPYFDMSEIEERRLALVRDVQAIPMVAAQGFDL